MKKLLFLFLLFAGINVNAQQTKIISDANAKQGTINGTFTAVNVATGVQLYLTQGNETALVVSVSDEKYEERLKTEVVDGVLKIYLDYKGISWLKDKNRKIKAYLSIKTLEGLTATSGADVILVNSLAVTDFKMTVTSGAAVNGEIKAGSLKVDQNSGSNINISGSVANFKIDVSSGAHFKGYDFVAENCTATVTSGAHADITITTTLEASANSGGKIQYKGNASVKNLSVNSGGSVKKG